MIKFLKKIALFFALMAVIDVACGYSFNVLRRNAKGGDTRKNYYIAEECCDKVVILGSSRAARHYVPTVIQDSLGMTCYNCGEPGCGIITAYARYGMIKSRQKPKLVLYEVSPEYDYYKTDDYSKYLGRVRQYAHNPVVMDLFISLGDNLERARLLSNMYRNNSYIVHNIFDNLNGDDEGRGFQPLYGVLSANAHPKNIISQQAKIDSLKLSYMERLILEMKADGITLCFAVSPRMINQADVLKIQSDYKPIRDLCSKYNVPFYDHMFIKGISDNRLLFQDFSHMNEKGAIVYTGTICEELRELLN